MAQEDYILREIEKIGILLKLIFDKIAGKDGSISILKENQIKDTKGLLLQETGFDTDLLLSLDNAETEQYISKFHAFTSLNIELLADIYRAIGMAIESSETKIYLKKALILYELCNSYDKTFSVERENKILEITEFL